MFGGELHSDHAIAGGEAVVPLLVHHPAAVPLDVHVERHVFPVGALGLVDHTAPTDRNGLIVAHPARHHITST